MKDEHVDKQVTDAAVQILRRNKAPYLPVHDRASFHRAEPVNHFLERWSEVTENVNGNVDHDQDGDDAAPAEQRPAKDLPAWPTDRFISCVISILPTHLEFRLRVRFREVHPEHCNRFSVREFSFDEHSLGLARCYW